MNREHTRDYSQDRIGGQRHFYFVCDECGKIDCDQFTAGDDVMTVEMAAAKHEELHRLADEAKRTREFVSYIKRIDKWNPME